MINVVTIERLLATMIVAGLIGFGVMLGWLLLVG